MCLFKISPDRSIDLDQIDKAKTGPVGYGTDPTAGRGHSRHHLRVVFLDGKQEFFENEEAIKVADALSLIVPYRDARA